MIYCTILTTSDFFHFCFSLRFLALLPEENCVKVVVGAKLDLVTDDTQRKVTRQEGRQLAAEINEEFLAKGDGETQIPFFETSSKTGEGVVEAFEYIFKHCLSPISDEYKLKAKAGTLRLGDKQTSNDSSTPTQRKCC